MKNIPNPIKFLIAILLGIFIADILVELLFDNFHIPYSVWLEDIVDSVVTVICALPIVYFLSFRPYLLQERSIRKLAVATEQSPSEVVITDKDGVVEYVNPKFTEITGYSKGDVLGENVSILKNDMDRGIYDDLWKTIKEGKEWFGEFHNRKKDGGFYWERAAIAPVKDESGKTISYVKMAEDVTERKQLEAMREDFIHMFTHELRTPIAVAKESLSQVLERMHGDVTDGQEKLLSMTSKGLDRLSLIVDDLLDIAKIEGGKIKLESKVADVRNVLERTRDILGPYVKSKGLELRMISPDHEVKANIDEEKILQVFTNLISNAAKFTLEGTIDFGALDKGDNVEFFVADTGVGIKHEDMPKLFKKMEQFETRPPRGEKGTGLGLAICKGLVELHGGQISAESEEKKGTKFTFILPKRV